MYNKYNKKYTINSQYFNKPNLENSYWAGFIAADGNLKQRWINSKTLTIVLQEKDLFHLQKFQKDIQSTHQLKLNSKNIEGYDKIYNSYRLEINDANIFDDLYNNFNIVPNKSLILKPPNLTIEQSLSYIKGYSDGDGCFTWKNNKTYKNNKVFCWQLLGTYKVLIWIKDIIDNFYCYKNNITLRQQKNIYNLSYTGHKAVEICKELDKINSPKLERKWNRIYE